MVDALAVADIDEAAALMACDLAGDWFCGRWKMRIWEASGRGWRRQCGMDGC